MIAPRAIEMTAIPVAWTPGTNGAIRAPIVVAPISEVSHFAAYRGKLAGKIVLLSLPGATREPKEPAFRRLTDKEIGDEDSFDAQFGDRDPNANNIIADIPGSDPKAGYVMAGAHFDSWIAGDGAADNGAGSVVVMEAARILRRLGVRPRRTIRFALREGEEQGLLGSRAYIERHLVDRPTPPGMDGMTAYFSWATRFPIVKKPGYGDLKADFNMDNGGGKFRGVYAEGNAGAVPLLREWMAPFNSMGAERVVAGKTGGTDHVFLQAVGLQGFQFIQDPLDDNQVHHSNLDTLDHLRPDDLRQASVVMAGMLLAAANSDKELPRPPLPTQPTATESFKYEYPDTN